MEEEHDADAVEAGLLGRPVEPAVLVLDKARELGLDPMTETDLAHLRGVTRKLAKLPTWREESMRGERKGGTLPDEG